MSESWNKKEREKKKQKERKDKAEKMQDRKENAKKGNFDDMIAYLDENGNLSSTPPDPRKRVEVNWKISRSEFPNMCLQLKKSLHIKEK